MGPVSPVGPFNSEDYTLVYFLSSQHQMRMLLTAAIAILALTGARPAGLPQDDLAPTVRRIAATTALAAQEYGIGVSGGKIVAAGEVEEARLFLTEARRTAGLLPPDAGRAATADIDRLIALVDRTASPDTVALYARQLGESLAVRFSVALDDIPAITPALARGAEVYQAECASCHGLIGRGDGLAGAGLSPMPADLTDYRGLAGRNPLDFYRRVTIGVAGTAMPAYESRLPAEARWAVAVYASTLRLPAAQGEVPPGLRAFATSARMTDLALAGALLPDADPLAPEARVRVAAVRTFGTAAPLSEATGLIFTLVRSRVDSTLMQAAAGETTQASTTAFDAYMAFEQVERTIRVKNPALANGLEAGFAALRTRAAGGATREELQAIRTTLLADLENAERTITDRLSPFNLFLQSFVLLLREGLEAILVVGALMAFLVKTGAGHRRRDLHVGVGAAIGASLLTALLLETILNVSQARQEALEGGVMLIAAAMLFYVSYWLLSKMEVAKWNRFVKGRVQEAVSSGSALALASVAFLAVYREGFETVLFYKALFLASSGSTLPVFLGMVAGGISLALVYLLINRFGVRIPLKPFFGFTSTFLYYMAFVFAGKGVAELQEGGLIETTVLSWAPRVPALGIYPTVESLALQSLLLLLLAAGLVWTFLLEPRRLRLSNEQAPETESGSFPRAVAPPVAGPPVPSSGPTFPPTVENHMLRSLDRMDADLAALRAEVERLKGMLTRTGSGRRTGD